MSDEGNQVDGDVPIPHVFISFDELEISGSDRVASPPADDKSRKVKRPDVQLYQPGVARRSLAKVKDNASSQAVDRDGKDVEAPIQCGAMLGEGQQRNAMHVREARRKKVNDINRRHSRQVNNEIRDSVTHGEENCKPSRKQEQQKVEKSGRRAFDVDSREATNSKQPPTPAVTSRDANKCIIAGKSSRRKATASRRKGQKMVEATESSVSVRKCPPLNDGDGGTHELVKGFSPDEQSTGQPSNAGDANNHGGDKLDCQRSVGGLLNIARTDSHTPSSDISGRSLYDPETSSQPPIRSVKDVHPRDMSIPYGYGARIHANFATYQAPVLDPAYMLPVSASSTYNYNSTPFYQHESPSHLSTERPSGRQKKVAAILRDVIPLEKQLGSLVARRFNPSNDYLEHVNRLRRTVREKLEHALLVDVEYSTNCNVDQMLWKSVYHQMLESLRSQLLSDDTDQELMDAIRSQINLVLDEAEENYHLLLAMLEKHSQFKLSNYTTAHSTRPMNRGLKLSLMMCQKILICLGDVARYRAQNSQHGATDYGRARKFYLQASYVAPKNGKPYNQLAITALHAKRRLDAVFYFVRSIAASNAFLSAKESLQAIYHEVIKKRNAAQREAEKKKGKSKEVNEKSWKGSQKRIEHWISPFDGSSVTDHVDSERDDDNPYKMPCNEVYRTLMSSFLCSQGMIYSKVSMENFSETCSQALYYLQALISHSPLPQLDLFKLTQMFAIAMFSISHTGQLMDVGMQAHTSRSYTQEQAIILYMDMATIVSERCTRLLKTSHTLSHLINSDLLQLLPLVKLFTDWMSCHPQLWNPAPCPRDPSLGPVLDPWSAMAQLANNLLAIREVEEIEFYMSQEATDEHVWLMFEEEQTLKGFLPLMNLANEDVYIHTSCPLSKVAAAMCYRVKKLVTFADYLCGIEPAMLEFDTTTCTYQSLVDPPSYSEQMISSTSVTDLQGESEVDKEAELSEVSSDDDTGNGTTDQLRKTKRRLCRQLAKQEKQQQLHQAVLLQESLGLLRINIRPVFVVPDTNCFIEYPNHMKVLVTSHKFTVLVPLVVINELDGISQSTPNHTHSSQARSHASASLEFLQSQFEERNRRLKAITISGNELTSIAFRTEETDSPETNDDRILSCCLHYCKDVARDFMPKDKTQAVTLNREVVLLTDDRNLRLKAHTRNVPVKDVIQFLDWANIGSTPC